MTKNRRVVRRGKTGFLYNEINIQPWRFYMKNAMGMKLFFASVMFTAAFLTGCGSSAPAAAPAAAIAEGDESKPQSSAFDTESHTEIESGSYLIDVPASWTAKPPYC